MISKLIRSVRRILATVLALSLIGAFTVFAPLLWDLSPSWGSERAAWVQAIFSTVAIAVAIWVPFSMERRQLARQAEERRERDAQNERRDLLHARSVAVGMIPAFRVQLRNLEGVLAFRRDDLARVDASITLPERATHILRPVAHLAHAARLVPEIRDTRAQLSSLGAAADAAHTALMLLSRAEDALNDEARSRGKSMRLKEGLEHARAAVSALQQAILAMEQLFAPLPTVEPHGPRSET